MVRLDERDLHAARVGDGRGYVEREGAHPLGVDTEHVDDQIRGALRAVDRAITPLRGQVRVVVRVRMPTCGQSASVSPPQRGGAYVRKYAVTPGMVP